MRPTDKSSLGILKLNNWDTNYAINFSLRYKYLFIENPKVACSTIKRILQVAEVDGDISQLSEDVHARDQSPIPQVKKSPNKFRELFQDPATFRFCFVRNPFSRTLSCYLDKFVKNEGERRRLSKKLGVPTDKVLKFHDFLLAVRDQTDFERDPHWMVQSYLLQPDRLRYDFIGRFEFIDAEINRMVKRIGLPQYAWKKEAPHATSAGERTKEYYGPKEIKLVQEIYEQDFGSFGYGWSP